MIFCFVLANLNKRQRIQDLPNTFFYIFDIFSLLANSQIKTGNLNKSKDQIFKKIHISPSKATIGHRKGFYMFRRKLVEKLFLQSMHKEVNSDKRIESY